MSKLFKTLCTLLVISSQAGAFNLKPLRIIPTGDLSPFFETLQENPDANDLARLYRVESSLPSVIKQPHSEFDLLYQKAISGQTELEAITKQIVKQSGAIIHSSGVKSKPRAIDKINSDFAGSSEHITDLARTSIVAQNVTTLVKSF